jgi:beta-glucanase (GH16 family)
MKPVMKLMILAVVLALGAGTAYAAFSNGDDVTVKVKGKVIGTVADGRLVVTGPNGAVLADPADVSPATTATTPTTTTPTTTTPTTTTPTTTTPPSTSTFVDDFTGAAGSKPDAAKWTDYGGEDKPCGAFVGWGNIMCGSNETLDGNGHLIVPATPSAGSGLQTKGLFSSQYGTFSAWIKMPSQAGYWPAFWLLNGSQTGGETNTGETDIVETYTTWAGANSRLHAWSGGSEAWESSNILYAQSACLSCAYHKYSAKMEPGKVTFYFDDVQVGQVPKQGTWYWGPDVSRGNFMILDLAVGGAGQATPSASAQMLVDKVEVTP